MRYSKNPLIALLFAALVALSALLGACGQKGDLYLPDQQEESKKKG